MNGGGTGSRLRDAANEEDADARAVRGVVSP